ncbi:hypothetical protein JST97_18150 [bacterium]|nr:hypothetical protein [bacterium]
MKKLICLALCALPWTAWARPETNLEELRAIDRRGQTWKSSVRPPADNRRWLADLTSDQFTLQEMSSQKGTWSSGSKAGVGVLKVPAQWSDHVVSLEISGVSLQGSVRLEAGGQEAASHANPKGIESRVNQQVNLSLAQGSELRWLLAPNSQFRLQRIRVYQLR